MIAVIAGSFSPLTVGHCHLFEKAAAFCDELYILVGKNSEKGEGYPLKKRLDWIEKTLPTLKLGKCRVHCEILEGLLVRQARELNAQVIIKGVRNSVDFEYEQNQARVNAWLDPEIQTLYLCPDPEFAWISSSNVRELLRYGQDISRLVPFAVAQDLLYKEA